MKYAIILAAGKGTRMKSSLNKVMHKVVDKPIIGHLVDRLESLGVDGIDVVVGYQQEQIRDYLGDRVNYSEQLEQLGTGHAVSMVESIKDKAGNTIILVGDCPLVQQDTMEMLYDELEKNDLVILTAQVQHPGSYGRIIRDNQGNVTGIVEARDCSEDQLKVKEINTGIFGVNNELLFEFLPQIDNNNSQQEYYLTDIVKLFAEKGKKIKTIRVSDIDEVMGINDRVQLSMANAWLQKKINEHWMREGVTIIDPHCTYISTDAILENDVTIYPNVHIKGKSVIKQGASIYPNSWIENSVIGSDSEIHASKVIDSEIGAQVNVGPFAHIRMHSHVEKDNRIGNFVELKNTHMKEDSRCAHLTYLGDSEIGSKVNIGCGVVTVNYDGKNKFKTIVGDGAFIGSNANLIAPITVGKNTVVAAGSTIKQDVADNDMVIVRGECVVKEGYGLKYKNKEKK